jgi:protease-4
LDLNQTVTLQSHPNAWFGESGQDLQQLLRRFDYLEKDRDARFIVLRLGRMRADFATAGEIRTRILRLRQSGKRVLAYLDPAVSPMNYFVASAADKVAAHPGGYFGVAGFASEVTFYKGFLDKIGVEAQFLRHGKYKSFVEPFTRADLSPEAESNLRDLLEGWWTHYVRAVSSARRIPENRLRAFFDRGEIDLDSARVHGLIDTLMHPDELAASFGQGKDLRLCPAEEEGPGLDTRWGRPEPVALVAWNGEITSGRSRARGLFGGESIGEETAVATLRALRRSSRVKAVVLRLDSPGGLAQASDRIAREIDLLRKEGKKVVVSVGGAAASGAYYFACRADAIVAEPASVVGSIGVVWGKAVTRGLYDKLGLTRDGLGTAPHADAGSSARPWTEEEKAVLQKHLDRFYAEFLEKVREGRHGKVKNLDSAAEGRVFTGAKALELGLVDQLGGLQTALDEAAKLAKLPAWKSRQIQRVESSGSWSVAGSVQAMGLASTPPWEEVAAWLKEWGQPQVWALDPALAALALPRP